MDTYIGKLTLYDLLGYLVPGFVVVLGLMWLVLPLCGIGFALPSEPWPIVLLLLLSYVVGHVLQSLAEVPLSRDGALRRIDKTIGKSDRALCVPLMASVGETGLLVAQFVDRLRLDIPEREWLVARQGFYRGMAGASAVIVLWSSVAIVAKLSGCPHASGAIWLYAVVMAAAVLSLIVMWRRYSGFVAYEIWFVLACIRRRSLEL